MDSEEKKEVTQVPNGTQGSSTIFGASVRSWLALILTITVCGMGVAGVKVEEPLYTMACLALGAYFGQAKLTKQ